MVDSLHLGVAAKDIPSQCYAVVDLYGQCESVTVVTDDNQQSTQPSDYREKADLEDSKSIPYFLAVLFSCQ